MLISHDASSHPDLAHDSSEAAPRVVRPLPAAVLWDMDGTLIDSEQYWIAAEHELMGSYGLAWTHEQGLALVGTPLPDSAEVFRSLGVPLQVPEIIEFLISRVTAEVSAEVPWQPGALAILERLRDQGVPCALVTASFRSLADAVVSRAPAGVFSAVVSGDEVTHGKPHPEPYLTAAGLLGVPIEECLVVEDSPSGIGSALACGGVAVAIEVMVPVEAHPRLSRVTSLDQLTPEVVHRVMAGEVVDLNAPIDLDAPIDLNAPRG